MVQRKTIWIAELETGNITCETKKEAKELEEQGEMQIEIGELDPIFRKYFKVQFDEHDISSYRYLCVGCGKRLIEWEAVWDGHRNNRGDCTFSEPCVKLFDGLRCPKCHKKAVQLFQKMLLFYGQKNNTINLIDISEWRVTVDKDETIILYLFRAVDFWYKNHRKRVKKRKKKVKT